MATLHPDLDEVALERLRNNLEAKGGSVEAELRAFIEERSSVVEADRQREIAEAAASLRAYRERIMAKYGPMPDSLEWLREDRAAWRWWSLTRAWRYNG